MLPRREEPLQDLVRQRLGLGPKAAEPLVLEVLKSIACLLPCRHAARLSLSLVVTFYIASLHLVMEFLLCPPVKIHLSLTVRAASASPQLRVRQVQALH